MNYSEFKSIYNKLNKEEKRKFIQNRVNDLINNSEERIIGININGSYDKFIGPLVELQSNSFFPNMKFDDYEIYEDFLKSINLNEVKGEPNLIIKIQKFIWNYFGYNTSDLFNRMNIYDTNDFKPVSIKEFKKNNTAACSERSAMVHNLLMFFGIKSEIVFGKINNDHSHAYIIFKPENTNNFRILYDPMNPVEIKNDDNSEYVIGVSKIDNDDYEKLKNGEQYKFNYDLVKKFYGDNKYIEKDRIYSCDIYEKLDVRSM